jgi:glycosyltransferase involved in cell wall biosynthesis
MYKGIHPALQEINDRIHTIDNKRVEDNNIYHNGYRFLDEECMDESANSHKTAYYSVSIVIPTLNSSDFLAKCLSSIAMQKYPRNLIEIIVVDGGSVDSTIEIAKSFGVDKILSNPLRTGEAAKAIGVNAASGDLVVFIDSDNELDNPYWLRDMVQPFKERDIFGCEALYWVYRTDDTYVNRYFALSGANDPLTLFAGNYCRYSFLTKKWTEVELKHVEAREDYLKITFYPGITPVTGAGNGGILRRDLLRKSHYAPYFADIDVVNELTNLGYTNYARVKHGTYHCFAKSYRDYLLKCLRRSFDYLYFRKSNLRSYPWERFIRRGLPKFLFSTLTVAPLLLQIRRGIRNKSDIAWFAHIGICWITLIAYGVAWLRALFFNRPFSR